MSKSRIDYVRLSKTMAFLLRHRPDVGKLSPDAEGFVELEVLCVAVSRQLRTTVEPSDVKVLLERAKVQRFELTEGRIRALKPQKERRSSRVKSFPPDILYHATNSEQVQRYKQRGALEHSDRRQIYLSADEAQAWRVAHRSGKGVPQVLFVDTARARRHGARFFRNRRSGLFVSDRVPLQDVLNLQRNFAEQLSAGGIPVRVRPDGHIEVALIRVTRRSGVTWEVAKGKLEDGEPPEHAAVREVQEEMGIEQDLNIVEYVGLIRYGFLAPGGLPRLKSVYLYLMELCETDETSFTPARGEGIGDVAWFDLDEACKAVTHTSLRPLMWHARRIIEQRYQSRRRPPRRLPRG